MQVSFIVLGDPVAKGRPRFARKGKYVQSYTPDKTANYETLVRLEYERQCDGFRFAENVPLAMHIKAYLPIPKSASQKKQKQMAEGLLKPLKRPDSTNICKSVEDSLNKIAYPDDAQIVETHIYRLFGEPPRIEVSIWEIRNEKES